MNFKNRIITALGGVPKETNSVRGNDFLRYGPRTKMLDDWKEVQINDEDVYKGYPYAVIQKRANKVASLARSNLYTWANPQTTDLYQKQDKDPLHPYLKLIEDSEDFSVKQFWKNICIYLDLAGAFYLGAVRRKVESKNPDKFPDLYGDITKFILLNPYEVKRVLDNNGKVVGYLETKKDGRQREWPPYMIIPMRELNPFNWDKVWSITDAAKEETYTLKQSGNFTRETLNGNLNAPGILTTDVILEDNQFADFVSRVRNHTKGEPVFGNGAGAIKWESMQQDLDRAALMDINEINRTALFAVSGTSKTALGIEQSGTTRDSSRIQTENFISDTAQPRLEDIIDFLNLDYKRYYPREYKATGYWIDIKSAASRDYSTETQATQMRQAQSALAFDLMQKGYTMQSSYDYAEGKIELSDLKLERGMGKPTDPEQDNPETPPQTNVEGPTSGDNVEDDKSIISDEETPQNESNEENTALIKREGLVPHSELLENSKKAEPSEEEHSCDCGKVEVLINELGGAEGKTLEESYKKFLNDIEKVQKETYQACLRKLTINAFEEDDIIGERKKKSLTNELKNIIQNYWWILTPLLANSLMEERNEEFGENTKFVFTNELQNKVENNATRVADGHMQTILDDVLTAANRAYTEITEQKAAELIVDAYKTNTPKYVKYFEEQPTMSEALKAIRNTDILEENRKIYERANELASAGYKREDIIKDIRAKWENISKNRAELIARNETSRAYGHSQYAADTQFLNSIGQLDTAYKQLVSRRPENEKDKICPICESIINMGPIPFTQNFVSLGETVTAERDGKVYNFVCNYEDIESSTIHPNCYCHYELILNGKTLNDATPDANTDDGGSDSGNDNSSKAKTVNGGPGSGNFGHSGRPGEVGGSSPSGKTIANPKTKVTAEWLDSHREYLSARGYTSEWVDEQIRTVKERDLKDKALKAKTTEDFDKAVEELKKIKDEQSFKTWMEVVGKHQREHLAKLDDMKANFDKEAQKESVEKLESTGVELRKGDKKWLEENCPAELVNGVTEGLREAESKGLNLKEVKLAFTDAKSKGGSCTFSPETNQVKIFLTRDWLSDVESATTRAQRKGPDGSKWWTNGKTNTCVTHECGHALVWQIIKNQKLNPYKYSWLCDKIIYEADDIFARNSGKDYWGSRAELSRNEDLKYISKYGRTNSAECIAESCNNSNYSEYTKIVNDLVTKGLKGEKQWQI